MVQCELQPAIIDDALFVGFATRQQLRKLLNDGDSCVRDVDQFYSAVRAFYSTTASYALRNLPIEDDVLFNSQFVNLDQRSTCRVAQMIFAES